MLAYLEQYNLANASSHSVNSNLPLFAPNSKKKTQICPHRKATFSNVYLHKL